MCILEFFYWIDKVADQMAEDVRGVIFDTRDAIYDWFYQCWNAERLEQEEWQRHLDETEVGFDLVTYCEQRGCGPYGPVNYYIPERGIFPVENSDEMLDINW